MRRLFLAILFISAASTASNAGHWAMGGSMWADMPSKSGKSTYNSKKKSKPFWIENIQSGKKKKSANYTQIKNKKGAAKWNGGAKPHIASIAPPIVTFRSNYAKGSIVIDTAGRKLYYILSKTKAYRYPVAVGRKGFKWSGTHKISKKVNWPTWRPPAEMRQRQPHLPKVMSGGINNPLGAKALYLGSTLYRIHGTNKVKSVGRAVSSGCFRMLNGHVTHLAKIASVGTTVRVLKRLPKKVRVASK